MKIFRYIGPADYITSLNGLLGFLAIMYIIDTNFRAAFIILLVVIILDGIDGWLARLLESEQQLGKYLDSISDTISFSFAPAILIYRTFYDVNYTSFQYLPNALVVGVCFVIVGFGMLRLAWFIEYGDRFEHFQGLPTPALALFIIIILQPGIQVWLDEFTTLLAVLIITFVTIADVQYPKIKKVPVAATAFITVILLITVIAFDKLEGIRLPVLLVGLFLIMIYILLGPLLITGNNNYTNSTIISIKR